MRTHRIIGIVPSWPCSRSATWRRRTYRSATVIDGDTIVVAAERIRLEGIDAPSRIRRAPPTASSGRAAEPRRSGCRTPERPTGRVVGHARDRYGRLLAVCYVGGESINEQLVREGWALNYRKSRPTTAGGIEAKALAPASGAASPPRHGSGGQSADDLAADRRQRTMAEVIEKASGFVCHKVGDIVVFIATNEIRTCRTRISVRLMSDLGYRGLS